MPRPAVLFLVLGIGLIVVSALPLSRQPALDVPLHDTFFVVSWFHLFWLDAIVILLTALLYRVVASFALAGTIHFFITLFSLLVAFVAAYLLNQDSVPRYATLNAQPATHLTFLNPTYLLLTLNAALLVWIVVQVAFPIAISAMALARRLRA